MKYLVDAQLPRRMVTWFADVGSDATHTLDLPLGNRTSDNDIISVVDHDEYVLITKDGDFVNSHLLNGRPEKLLFVTTGNISNRDLEQLLIPLISRITVEFQLHSFLELGPSGIIIRG